MGDVVQIALLNGRFAYGRLYDDAAIGIYRKTTAEPGQPPIGSRDFQFHVGIYDDVITSGQTPVVGQDPFTSDESYWPPPPYILDELSGEFSLYHKGIIASSTEQECEGLEETGVWDLHHIIDRIMSEASKVEG